MTAGGDQERKDRIARNEVLFRTINERLDEIVPTQSSSIGFLCECGDGDCIETVSMTKGEYERVRSDPRLFVLVREHVAEDVERVVEENERFAIVEKNKDESAIAEATDPRS